VATSLTETSTKRFKMDINPLENQLDTVMMLNPVTFKWIDSSMGNGLEYGLIAEELYKIYPDLVKIDRDGNPESISYTKMVSILIKSIQELKEEINKIKERFNGCGSN
jgi:hypothetical protein